MSLPIFPNELFSLSYESNYALLLQRVNEVRAFDFDIKRYSRSNGSNYLKLTQNLGKKKQDKIVHLILFNFIVNT